jgi:hypothetical protein
MKPKLNRKPGGMDNCQTPFYAIEPLINYLDPTWVYWDCACGEGNLVNAMVSNGFRAFGTDILSGNDFFTTNASAYDCIITNPPFSLKYHFLKRCYELKKPFILLMPVEVLGAKTAQDMFISKGIELMFLDHRINFKMPYKGWDCQAQFPTMWFCYGIFRDVDYTPVIWEHIDPKGRKE